MEQITKTRQRQDDGQPVEQVPDAVNEQSAELVDEADDLLAELDAMLEENTEVLADANNAADDFLTRWDEEAKAVEAQANSQWEEQDRGHSFCGC